MLWGNETNFKIIKSAKLKIIKVPNKPNNLADFLSYSYGFIQFTNSFIYQTAVYRCLWGSLLAEADMSLWSTAWEQAEGLVQADLHWLLHRPHVQPKCPLAGWRQIEGNPGLRLLHCGGGGAEPGRGSVLVWCVEQKLHLHQAGRRLLSQK